jgi:hypothetical protein
LLRLQPFPEALWLLMHHRYGHRTLEHLAVRPSLTAVQELVELELVVLERLELERLELELVVLERVV